MERPIGGIPSTTVKKKTGCGAMYVTVSTLPEFPEVFIRLGKAGGCAECWCQAMGRVISFALRFTEENTLEQRTAKIVHALKGIQCPSPMYDGSVQNTSCPDAIAKALEYNEGTKGKN